MFSASGVLRGGTIRAGHGNLLRRDVWLSLSRPLLRVATGWRLAASARQDGCSVEVVHDLASPMSSLPRAATRLQSKADASLGLKRRDGLLAAARRTQDEGYTRRQRAGKPRRHAAADAASTCMVGSASSSAASVAVTRNGRSAVVTIALLAMIAPLCALIAISGTHLVALESPFEAFDAQPTAFESGVDRTQPQATTTLRHSQRAPRRQQESAVQRHKDRENAERIKEQMQSGPTCELDNPQTSPAIVMRNCGPHGRCIDAANHHGTLSYDEVQNTSLASTESNSVGADLSEPEQGDGTAVNGDINQDASDFVLGSDGEIGGGSESAALSDASGGDDASSSSASQAGSSAQHSALPMCECDDGWAREPQPDAVYEKCTYELRSQWALLLLSMFFGWAGADWMYLARGSCTYIFVGTLKLVTLGGFGLWWFVDVTRTFAGTFPDGNGYLPQTW